MSDVETERVELPDGGWWEVRVVVTRGMRKRFNRAALAMLPPGLALDGTDAEALKRAALSDISKVNLTPLEDAWLVEGTVAYSYGEKVTLDAIDALPDEAVQKVLDRMTALYGGVGLPEEQRKAFLGGR